VRAVHSQVLDAATRSHSRALLVIAAVALLTFLPGVIAIPTIDRDEARFAQATKQMLETGDYINIRFQDEPRLRKPIGIYWLQAAVVDTARSAGVHDALTTIALYRVPSLAGAIGASCLTYWAALALVSRRAAVLAALMLATCALLGVEARLAKTDAMLLLTAVAAMGGLARVYLAAHGRPLSAGAGWGAAAVTWTALAAGTLLKGPVLLLVAGLCVTALAIRDRSIRWLAGLRPLAGCCWFVALVAPWFLTVLAQPGSSLIAEMSADILPRLFRGIEGHAAPPGYYIVLFWVTFWPGATLAGLALPAVIAARRAPATAFLLAWLLPSWIVLELAVTKLPHYVLPLYPAIAVLIAQAVDVGQLSRQPALIRLAAWGFIVPLLVGVLGIGALILAGIQPDVSAGLLAGAAVVAAFAGWRRLAAGHDANALLCSVAAAVLLSVVTFGVAAPRLRPLFPSATFAALLAESGCPHPKVVTSPSYFEPSLVFVAGTATRASDADSAAAFVSGGPCRFALVEAADADRFRLRANTSGVRQPAGRPIEGINAGNGAAVRLVAFWSGP
jgi:4-amino-4-deoxy-L-arabinose transferase-like glycosyltransferase